MSSFPFEGSEEASTPEEIALWSSLKWCFIEHDVKSIYQAQHTKTSEEAKLVQLRKLLWQRRLPKSIPYSDDYQRILEQQAEHFITAPNIHVICRHPLLVIIDDFMTEAECRWALAHVDEKQLKPQEIQNAENSKAIVESKLRRSHGLYFQRQAALPRFIYKKLHTVFGKWLAEEVPESQMDCFLTHYPTDGFLRPHYDSVAYFPTVFDRRFSSIVYLHDMVVPTGATTFDLAKIVVNPKRGRMILFANTPSRKQTSVPAVPDLLTLHSGERVVAGTKTILTTFLFTSDPGFTLNYDSAEMQSVRKDFSPGLPAPPPSIES